MSVRPDQIASTIHPSFFDPSIKKLLLSALRKLSVLSMATRNRSPLTGPIGTNAADVASHSCAAHKRVAPAHATVVHGGGPALDSAGLSLRFRVPSRTSSAVWDVVVHAAKGQPPLYVCTCPARRKCAHIDAVSDIVRDTYGRAAAVAA